MRTGGTLVLNALSLHSRMMIFNERINYFRFVHKKYNPLTPESIDRMLNHHRIRLKHRVNVPFETDAVLESILARGIAESTCYEELMQSLVHPTGKEIWGEYANLSWRYIPNFLEMFPNGKVVHICRDLRGVLASFGKISFMPDNLYLNSIFNWIDSVNFIRQYRDTLSPKSYMVVRFEDIHLTPEKTLRTLCKFLDEPFEDVMIETEKWPELLEQNNVKVNVSVYTNKKVYGFDPKRNETWKDSLQKWEIALCDYLAGDLLEEMGYDRLSSGYQLSDLEYGMNQLKKQPYLLKTLNHFEKTGEGVDHHPVDPTDPVNWSSADDGFKHFTDTPAYKKYMRDMSNLEDELKIKYSSAISF